MSSIAKVKEYLARFGAAGRGMELDHSSATVELAAQALGVEGARIAKSLSFHMGEGCMIIVMAGDVKVDNARFKATFGFKAKMLTADEALAMTGHAVGGVCPFALPEGVKVYLDESLRRFETVFPACGSGNSAIELTCDELAAFTPGSEWISVTKLPHA